MHFWEEEAASMSWTWKYMKENVKLMQDELKKRIEIIDLLI